jgi:ABC-type phosphate/phosphonate transport system substrate-binding protein
VTHQPAALFRAVFIYSVLSIPLFIDLSQATTNQQSTTNKNVDSHVLSTLVFSAPPRETPEEGRRIYQPIAEYLSQIIGRPIHYNHPGNWLSYQSNMLRGQYDLIFDGPHFNSWRIAHLQHQTLAKLGEAHTFAVIVRHEKNNIGSIDDIVGKKLCGMNPPNLGTLAILSEFSNPARQPLLTNEIGWHRIYQAVLNGKCTAGIVPIANLRIFDPTGRSVRVIYRSQTLPNQAFSAGPRVAGEEKVKISHALLSLDMRGVLSALQATYGSTRGFVATHQEDYNGIDRYLKDVWGYGR